jgi:hypothetical protein
MNENELLRRFPNASAAFVRANADAAVLAGHPRSPAKLEPDPGYGTLGAVQAQAAVTGRVFVRLTSYRRRLLDEDNLCEKYVVDCCRYAGILAADSPGQAQIEVRQTKVGKGEAEFTRVEIYC